MSHDREAQAELNAALPAAALKAHRPSHVLATVGDLVAQMLDGRDHPVDELVAYGVRYSCVKAPRRAL